MATFDFKKGDGEAFNTTDGGALMRLVTEVDCFEQNLAVNDIIELFNIPPGCEESSINVIMETVEGSTATMKLGNDGSNIAYGGTLDMNATAAKTTNGLSRFVTVKDKVLLTANNTMVNAKFKVIGIFHRISI